MSTLTLNPWATAGVQGPVTINIGGDNYEVWLADNDDGTSVTFGNASALVLAPFVTSAAAMPTLPAGAKVISITGSLRLVAVSATGTITISIPKAGGGAYTASKKIGNFTQQSFITSSPVSLSINADATTLDLNNISFWTVRGSAADDGSGYFLVAKEWVAIKYLRIPVVTVDVTPTDNPIATTNRPTVVWSNSLDPDGGPQFAWNLKIFTAAQYGAAGFNPDVTDPLYEVGGFSTSTFSHQLPEPLANGTYRAYVKTTQLYSNWSSSNTFDQFTLNVPSPGTPTLQASAENDEGRNRLVAASTSGATTTSLFEFQYLDVETSEWKPMRTDNDVGWVTDNPATLYDYEAPNGEPQQYRVRAVHLFDLTTASVSAWSTRTVTMQTGWWLKHPLLPLLNTALRIASFNGQQRQARLNVQQPLGRDDAVATMDSRGPETGEVGIRTHDSVELERVQTIASEKTPLLLQAAYDTDEPDRWVVLGDETVERLIDNKAMERRNVTYAWTRVKRPSNKHHQTPPPDSPGSLKTYTEEVQADGPALWWRLNETGGTTLADSSGHNRTGKIYSGDVVSNADVSFDGSPLITEDLTKHSIYMHGHFDVDENGNAIGVGDNPGVGFKADNYQPFQPGAKLTMEVWLYKISSYSFNTIFAGSSDHRASTPTTTMTGGARTIQVGTSYTLPVASTLAAGGQPAFPAASSQDATKGHLRLTTNGGTAAFTYASKTNTSFLSAVCRGIGNNSTPGFQAQAADGAAVVFGAGAPYPTWEFINPSSMRFYSDVNTYPVGWVDWGTNLTGHPVSSFQLNEATHVVCTFDDTTGICEWFINGVSMGAQGPLGYAGVRQEYSKLLLSGNFQFGHRGFNPDNPNWEVYDGLVDNIAVYEKILPQQRIAAHFTAGTKNAGVVQPPPIIEEPEVVVDDRLAYGFAPGGGFPGLSTSSQNTQMTDMKAMGAKWIRVDIPWSAIQTTSSTDPTTWNWTTTDRMMNNVAAQGLWPWAMIGYSPQWLDPTKYSNWQDKFAPIGTTQVNAYANFCLEVAKRYGATNKCHVFEVWNEPNIAGFFNIAGAWVNDYETNRVTVGNAYANLLKAAYPKLKQGDPDCVVLPGGTSPAPDQVGVAAWDFSVNPVTWYSTLYQSPRSCKAFMDGLSHHPYHSPSFANKYDNTPTNFDWSAWRQMTGHLSPTPSIRSVMQANGDGTTGTANRKKIWIGEVGVPTRGTNNSVVDENTAAYMEAVFMAEWKHYAAARSGDTNSGTLVSTYWDLAGPMCVYTYKDDEDDAAANPSWDRHEGVYRLAGGAKPSRDVFSNVANAWNALG